MASGHNCNDTKEYSEQFDTYYCKECNKWLESTCEDPTCEFCKKRPQQPNSEQ